MTARTPTSRRQRGFSLVEMLVAMTVLAMVIAAISTVLIHASFTRFGAKNRFESMQTARAALDLLARDLRSAGYGTDARHPAGAQPAIAYVDSMQIILAENLSPWPDTSATPGAPQAYDPAGSPKPFPLVGSSYTPPVRYTTGAELVRWTLDLDDDGVVDADDVAASEGADARRSRNPDDFTLVRRVYGAGSGGVALNNGGSAERIALVLKPGGAVAPLFTVYLNGSSTPWDWSSGPVPAASLAQITRVVVKITAPSGRPDSRGSYSSTLLETAVGSMRNAPQFGAATCTVDGWVFADADFDGALDAGESGLPGAVVQLGAGRVTYSSSSGYWSFQVPAGSYLLKHTPPSGYGSYSNPDSFALTVTGNTSRSFADTVRTGGWISVHAWNDTDGDGTLDAGEAGHSGTVVTLTPGGQNATTDGNGDASLFAQSGSWSVAVTPPDGHTVTTANPCTGTMTNGGSATVTFGLLEAGDGTVTGTVYNDTNRNGTRDAGETGIAGVTVSAFDGGTLAARSAPPDANLAWAADSAGARRPRGFAARIADWLAAPAAALPLPLGGLLGGVALTTAVTDASGNYTLTLPALSGSLTRLFTITCAAVSGRQPTTALSLGGLSVLVGHTSTGHDFGFGTWTTKTISTGSLENLVATDVWENDRTGTSASPRTNGDVDLVDAEVIVFVPTIRYWGNIHPTSPPFTTPADAFGLGSRNSRAMLLDTLSGSAPRTAPDLVLGYSAGTNNWAYWKRSASSASPPVLATTSYATADQGDANAILAIDCSGGAALDLLIGTRSSSGQGKVEVWQSNDGSSPTFTRQETYPAAGSIPGAHLGEVNGMALADLDGDGARDLVIVTQTSSTTGEIVVMKNSGRTNGGRFVYQTIVNLSSDAVKHVALADFDEDGYTDIVVGTQTSSTTGRVVVYRNTHATSAWTFTQSQAWSAPGAVTALEAADVGGSTAPDLLVGYVTNTASSSGGLRLYYNQSGTLATNGVDPSGGTISKSVIAIATGNFNYATYPSATSAPYLTDFAVAYNQNGLQGTIMAFIR